METFLKALGGALTVIITGYLLYLLGRDAGKSAGKGQLRYGPWLAMTGVLTGAFFLAIGYLVYRHEGLSEPFALLVFSGFLIMSLALIAEALFVRIRYDERGIYTNSPWRRSREIPWHAVNGHSYSEVNRWHILETRAYGRIRLSIYLRGLPDFFEELKERSGLVAG